MISRTFELLSNLRRMWSPGGSAEVHRWPTTQFDRAILNSPAVLDLRGLVRREFPLNRYVLDCLVLNPRLLQVPVIVRCAPTAFGGSLCSFAFISCQAGNMSTEDVSKILVACFVFDLILRLSLGIAVWWMALRDMRQWQREELERAHLPPTSDLLPHWRNFRRHINLAISCFTMHAILECAAFISALSWIVDGTPLVWTFIIFVVDCLQRIILLTKAHNGEMQWHLLVLANVGTALCFALGLEHGPLIDTLANRFDMLGPRRFLCILFTFAIIYTYTRALSFPHSEYLWAVVQTKERRWAASMLFMSWVAKAVYVLFLYSQLLLLVEPQVSASSPMNWTLDVKVAKAIVPDMPVNAQIWIAVLALVIWSIASIKPAKDEPLRLPEMYYEQKKVPLSAGLGPPEKLESPKIFVRSSRFFAKPVELSDPIREELRQATSIDNWESLHDMSIDSLDIEEPGTPLSQGERQNPLCLVCLEEPRSVVLEPCLHFVSCEACVESFVSLRAPTCPICRAVVSSVNCVQPPGAVPLEAGNAPMLVVQSRRGVVFSSDRDQKAEV